MTRLAEILDQMSAVLNDLKTVMDQEQQHLSMGQINGSQLPMDYRTKKLSAGDAGLPRTVTQERTQYSK
ncbi:Flagella synthesis protein FlgN [Escherichia coli]|uniref:Flagella synthesis protein FlgN n=1 Tax=Escherichia coli TaxID=562 RepID=A0A377K824_ECOLX|nr:Flagella synthesis protein FlgN [Escherichia coli]